MIKLNRSKNNKWILQKNISSGKLLETFIEGIKFQNNSLNKDSLKDYLSENDSYHGRSKEGSSNTMGVRLSQACFYMFGYKKSNKFFPSPMTKLLLDSNDKLSQSENMLINLFSMQFPSPYSNTPSNFEIFIGRLIIKLLLDKKLDEKLYIDECIYFLMFLEKIDENSYSELVQSILEYRTLTFEEKSDLFKKVPNYNEVFANATHEMNYYFIRIFRDFKVFDVIGDELHNDGKIFEFVHGNNSAIRKDAYDSRKKCSGYIKLHPDIKTQAIELINNFSLFSNVTTQKDTLSKEDWKRELYEFAPLKYIETIMERDDDTIEVIEYIKSMVYHSKYGSRDGKSFENSLVSVFKLFRENREVNLISGSGDTDLLCVMDTEDDILYKINVDAKTSRTTTNSILSTRIDDHLDKNGSEYCIIVSPRFAKGVKRDIKNFNIVTVEAETLANYCLNSCLSSKDRLANYSRIDNLIRSNLGKDITDPLNELIDAEFNMA